MAMYGKSPTVPTSWMGQMWGCSIRAWARASRMKRSWMSALPCRMILMATQRPSRGSRARYTRPIPPSPMNSMDSYRSQPGTGKSWVMRALPVWISFLAPEVPL